MGCPTAEALGAKPFDEQIGQRNVVPADTVDAEQAEHRALDRDGRMGFDEAPDRLDDLGGQPPRPADEAGVDSQFHASERFSAPSARPFVRNFLGRPG